MRMAVPETLRKSETVGVRKWALGGRAGRHLLLACCAALGLPVSAAGGAAGIAGVGARPISDKVAATWFIETASPSDGYRTSLMVFLVGPAGWTKKRTDWRWGTGDPAHSTFLIDGHRLHLEFSSRSGRWSVLSRKGNVKEANVLVVAEVGSERQHVVHTEKLPLLVPFDSDPVVGVVKQSHRLRQILGL